MMFVGSIVLLLVLLRYISIKMISSNQDNIKEVPMKITLNARIQTLISSLLETGSAIGVGIVVAHLST